MMTLGEIMSREVVTASPEMTLREAAHLLSEGHIGGAPVVEGGCVVGVVSATDLLEFAAEVPRRADEIAGEDVEAAEGGGGGPEQDEDSRGLFFTEYWRLASLDAFERMVEEDPGGARLLDGWRVADVMSRAIYALPPSTDIAAAAEYMLEADVHRVLVIDDDRLVGVVTTTDMVRAMSGRASPS